MPLSADHTVHLTRVYLYGEQLAGGHLVGWSPTWFFGFPLGELYPVLGDLGVLALRVLSLGLLDWPQAYALLFTLVFLTQGFALLRCGRALGWGPVPGLCAALLALADVGAYREGGWTYTVLYGVWPQTLATALAWLTFAELALAARAASPVLSDSTTPPVLSGSASSPVPPDSLDPPPPVPRDSDHSVRRHLALATLAAAGALLAHPMALMMLALGAPLYFITVGLRGGPRRSQLAETALHLALALTLGAALAAWWLLPMSAHRGWMANYGWLHAPLADMLRMASHGQWTQFMPTAVGHCASLGLLAAALLGRAPLRFFALWTVAHWLLASTDLFWGLRLDWLSGGFQHIQYQRFLIAAKPGFFLLAGAALGGLCHLAVRTWSNRHVRSAIRRPLTGLAAALALALALWQLVDTRAQMQRGQVGQIQTQRMPGAPRFAADYAAFLAWARATWDARDADYRISFRADRNLHWFMDSPVYTHTPSYKQGFTPGDNFVHKPESGDPALLRRLGVRYLVSTSNMLPSGATRLAQFGQIHVFALADPEPLAHLEGSGELTVEQPALAGDGLRVRVRGVTDERSRLVLHVAGYPRWQLHFTPAGAAGSPDELVEWYEVPVLGDSPTATQAQRRAGELRGGKALGDDGREPTLIAAPARDGSYELRYDRWRRVDILGLGLGLLGLLGLAALTRHRPLLPRLRPWARRLTHPALLIGLLVLGLALAALRHRQGAAREHDLASARLQRGAARNFVAGPLKTDMLVLPALLARPGRSGMSEVTFPDVQLGPNLDGWYALDDDDAKLRRRGNHRLRIAARPHGAADWTPLADLPVRHRPDRNHLDDIAVPPALQAVPVDLRVELETSGEAPPRFGLDLKLPGAAP
ncbi:hypothetical protein [Nannocystis sp.]|uniref:hypothetical protein n=1 Tax=Nannocystis sp. TaxID=1962667 RepID=UPI0025F24D40|nr:hypothetical protein [Nannocystis sp.]MBK7830239.1 hypothetical protein [Nannocystis sp.]